MKLLVIIAPRKVCIEKANEYELGWSERELMRDDLCGVAAYSPVLDQRVVLTFTDVNYTYKREDFKEYYKDDPDFMVWSPDKAKFPWIERPLYFNA